ncbi:B12-binding domain-containing radical SAM protein, partial [bacterium]|nr:B12-binding domain-containing radical SAM protein [bacterium]
ENVATPDYAKMPRPDLVGLTAFTSQAPRAYEVAAMFRDRGVPVVMGGIHATVRQEEAAPRVDAVLKGEAEGVWPRLLEDAAHGALQPVYEGGRADIGTTAAARHDLLTGYEFGAIQTTRGCPLACSFCSVTAFNGRTYRRRAIADVVDEFRRVPERRILVVDDNLVGTRKEHIDRAKELFRAMIDANLRKQWVCQATINMADDDELLDLARRSGCTGVFIGFESTTPEGLAEIHKKYNIQSGRNFRDSVRRIQSHGITVAGSFIMGLDVDQPGIGLQIARTAEEYGVDVMNVLFLTPLPGTNLWDTMEREGRIVSNHFPEDWKYYTLTFPLVRYRNMDRDEMIEEMNACNREFYSVRRVIRRVARSAWKRQQPVFCLVGNLASRHNGSLGRKAYRGLDRETRHEPLLPLPATGPNRHVLKHGA